MRFSYLFCGTAALLCFTLTASADTIELMNGNAVEGKVLGTDATRKTVTVEAAVGGQTVTRTLPNSQVHALTVNGQRTVVTPKPGSPASPASATANAPKTRTEAEVKALITEAGGTPPDWLKSTKLNFPKTLDLSWQQPPPGGKWDNQKNVGQFIWDVINPNENRWREGIKFMEHVLDQNKSNEEIRLRASKEIANMYFRFFQDYARAAWWWEKSGLDADDPPGVHLAECYWRLGNKQMAMDMIDRPGGYSSAIKLLGDMGETDKAVEFAKEFVDQDVDALDALVHAGDACRLAGRLDQAITLYEQALKLPPPTGRKPNQRMINQAQTNLDAIRLFEKLDISKLADGSYKSSSLGYEGDVEVAVKVKGRRIDSVKVTQHKEKQYYSSMRDVPEQIIAKQGVKGVDATSRATITGNAIINATAKALSGAGK
ncbi:hypothetical protein AYO49_00875 [Verrucomicrobiaceae bacterium SCGC AG-212-N21]|nr:hypothetical protein AYO49_00875 [Verrucomicrobiaceae bacterium SCGC AG-212-N21]